MWGRTAKSVVLALSFMQSCAGFVSVRGPCAVRREPSPSQPSLRSSPLPAPTLLFHLKDPSLRACSSPQALVLAGTTLRTSRAMSLSMSGGGGLDGLTIVQLKEKLRAAGLPVSGKKQVLIERLSSGGGGSSSSSRGGGGGGGGGGGESMSKAASVSEASSELPMLDIVACKS